MFVVCFFFSSFQDAEHEYWNHQHQWSTVCFKKSLPLVVGVGILLSRACQSVETVEILAGRALLVQAMFEDKRLFFLSLSELLKRSYLSSFFFLSLSYYKGCVEGF